MLQKEENCLRRQENYNAERKWLLTHSLLQGSKRAR